MHRARPPMAIAIARTGRRSSTPHVIVKLQLHWVCSMLCSHIVSAVSLHVLPSCYDKMPSATAGRAAPARRPPPPRARRSALPCNVGLAPPARRRAAPRRSLADAAVAAGRARSWARGRRSHRRSRASSRRPTARRSARRG
eukprot:2926279-Prymnesium_polylepis.1